MDELNNNVREIQKLALTGVHLNGLTPVPAVVVHDDFKVHSLEDLQTAPQRIRQNVTLATAQALIDYANKFKFPGTAAFTDLDSCNVKVVFDYHASASEPRWGSHTANYTCPRSKDWKEWAEFNKKPMSQVEFGLFVEKNIHCIASEGNIVSGAELLSMVLAFQETRSVEFKSAKRLQDGTMTFSFSDEKNGAGNTKLPEEIVLGLQPFHNGDSYAVKARIRYRIKDSQLYLWYDLINPEQVVEDAFNNTVEQLKAAIPDVDFFEGVI